MKVPIPLIALALAACGSFHGEVHDGMTGRPVAGVTVSVSNTVWGIRDGQLVWDKEEVTTARTDERGRFVLPVAGGGGLRVDAPGYPPFGQGSLCPRSPMLVRIGGPYPDLKTDTRLVFDLDGRPVESSRDFDADRLGLKLESNSPEGSRFQLSSRDGVQFVAGRGTIPLAPPLPYPKTIELETARDCGWIFVAQKGKAAAVIAADPPGLQQDPGQSPVRVMLFALLQ